MNFNNVYDLTSKLKSKRTSEDLELILDQSGWTLREKRSSVDSNVVFYVLDTKSDGMAVFGVHSDQLLKFEKEKLVHWGHFVLAWDVLVDETMAHDDTHIKNTLEMFMGSFLHLSTWNDVYSEVSDTQRIHVVVLVNRNDLNNPNAILKIKSDMVVLDEVTLRSALESYLQSN